LWYFTEGFFHRNPFLSAQLAPMIEVEPQFSPALRLKKM
jgi:hypothetical protein